VTAIAAGYAHSLAVQSGGVWAWGFNYSGQLGNNSTTDSLVPVALTGILSSGVTAIAAGAYHSLAVQSGSVYAWGYNVYGELGNNSTTDSHVPVALASPLNSGVTAIAAGAFHSVAVQNGGVYAWGLNNFGQLGNNSTANRSTPIHVDPTDLSSIVAVSAGKDTSFALAADGSLWV